MAEETKKRKKKRTNKQNPTSVMLLGTHVDKEEQDPQIEVEAASISLAAHRLAHLAAVPGC